jgi:hypothetical protein
VNKNYANGDSLKEVSLIQNNKEESPNTMIPEEYQGLSSNQLECNIKKLEIDM